LDETQVMRQADAGTEVQLEDLYQVVLHNDDHNTMERVVGCLMQVFGHPMELAEKIMLEAHSRGKAIAEVEGETEARTHCGQLLSFGLTATVEKV
jgi:ATP-dependent Clp protease adaptor protein ClpS